MYVMLVLLQPYHVWRLEQTQQVKPFYIDSDVD